MSRLVLIGNSLDGTRQLRGKLMAVMLGAAAACLMDAAAYAGPKDPATRPPVAAQQRSVVDGHRIQPRGDSSSTDRLNPDDRRAVDELYRQLMSLGASNPASPDR